MNSIENPFTPGAGTPPPELAGRDNIMEQTRVAIERCKLQTAAQNIVLLGLRGVGKTVLLEQIMKDAVDRGIYALRIESPEKRSLPALLVPEMRIALLKLSKVAQAKELALRGLRGLASFAKGLRVKYQDLEIALGGADIKPEVGLADNGDLEHDLQDLLEAVGQVAASAKTALILFIDEMQYVQKDELAALLTALHRTAQRQQPVLMVAAGLPQLRGQMGDAKSYTERLVQFFEIGPLPADAARTAIEKPLLDKGVGIEEDALQDLLKKTQGYPYFLQEWGKQTWDTAESSPITKNDVSKASELVIAALDASFFRVRFDRLTPNERTYLRWMAELGAGPHRTGDIAAIAGKTPAALGPVRGSLGRKGMIWSPNYGDTAFTVPLFDGFMRRIMPKPDDALDELAKQAQELKMGY